MSPVRVRARAVVIATVAVVWLIGVAGANGAAWQPSTPISQQGATVSDGAQIALGPSGDAAAGWADDVAGGRLVLARKRAGEGWSAPAGIPACGMAAEVFPAVDAAGDVTGACAGSSGSVVVVNWAAAATNPTSTPIPDSAGFTVSAVAMNAAGDAVFAATNLAPASEVLVGYRHGFGGIFAMHHFADGAVNADNPRVAINAAGMAVVAFHGLPVLPATGDTALLAAIRTANSDWGSVEIVSPAVQDIVPAVGIDAVGNVLAAFTRDNGGTGNGVVQSSRRPPAGGWTSPIDLSSDAPGDSAMQVRLAVNDAGAALVVWAQDTGLSPGTAIAARSGTVTAFGPIEAVNDTGADTPRVTMGADGQAGVSWDRAIVAGSLLGQVRIRAPGPGGTWGEIHSINQLHGGSQTVPEISTDGHGDFAAATAPDDGTTKPFLLAVYDGAPPVVSPIAVAGTLLAGDPVGLSVTATDAWSPVGAPTWTFGDGTAGTGRLTHLSVRGKLRRARRR